MYYPTPGGEGQVLAMNGVPVVEVAKSVLSSDIYATSFQGHTSDGGFVIKFEEGTEKRSAAPVKTKV